MKQVTIYTDGACSGNPGPGGWGAILKYGAHEKELSGVIDSRYRSRRPMIITTNLKLAELKNPPDLAHARIYDRILERCAPILFDGNNFREENAGATRQAAKDIVNSKHD